MNHKARYRVVTAITESDSLETAARRVLDVYREELGCVDGAVVHGGEQIASLSDRDFTQLGVEPPERLEASGMWIHCTGFALGRLYLVSEEQLPVETLSAVNTVSTTFVDSFSEPAVIYTDDSVCAANEAYRALFPEDEVLTATDGGLTTRDGRTFSYREFPQTESKTLGVFVDITAETERLRTLERFYGEVARLFDATTRRAAVSQAMRLAEQFLGAGYGVVYLYDEVEGLTMIDRCFHVGETDKELARTAYCTNQPQSDETNEYYPLGNHGVMILDGHTEFSHILAVITTAALDKARREQGLFNAQVIVRRVLELNDIDKIPALIENSIEELFRIADVQAIPYTDTEGITEFGTDNIVVPVGDWGAIVLSPSSPVGFPAVDRQTFGTLGENLATAIRLVEYRQELDILNQVLSRALRHNLRNELTVLSRYAEEYGDEDLHRKIDDIETICEYTNEMQNIVKRRNTITRMKLADCVRRVTAGCDVDLTVEANPEKQVHVYLENAVEHLVQNAIEHGEPPVELTVTADEIVVSDQGRGIPKSEIEPIQRHGESALEHGSGLGLWIADRVAAYSNAELQFDDSAVRIAF